MPAAPPDLSVIIPVYNGADFVAERLTLLSGFLEASGLDYELLPVDDGSRDATADVLRGLTLPRTTPVLCPANGGKFAAIKRGMAEARGRCRLFTDADVPYELDAIPRMAELVLERGFHIVVGDRTLPGSSYAEQLGAVRRATTQAFTLFVRLFVTSGLADTQCGIKALRGDVADALFPLLVEHRFAGDVELLYIALRHNLEVKRVPVRLAFQGDSTVRPVADGLRMLGSLARIRVRRQRGAYDSEALTRIATER